MSTTCRRRHHLIAASTVLQLPLLFPETLPLHVVSSCDGILLFDRPPLLWNPSIRKFKILPPLSPSSYPRRARPWRKLDVIYAFGYDHFIDNYKIFAVSSYLFYDSQVDGQFKWKNEVSVYILGYDSWRRIDDIPCDGLIQGEGIFVSGTVNWLAVDSSDSSLPVLVSLDLEKESYRKQILTPDLDNRPTLLVLMDCLCILTNSVESLDVWVMKEYGINESWTKLFSVSSFYYQVVSVSEDGIVLLDLQEASYLKLDVYSFRNGTFKISTIQNISGWRDMVPRVYVDSLISPCS